MFEDNIKKRKVVESSLKTSKRAIKAKNKMYEYFKKLIKKREKPEKIRSEIKEAYKRALINKREFLSLKKGFEKIYKISFDEENNYVPGSFVKEEEYKAKLENKAKEDAKKNKEGKKEESGFSLSSIRKNKKLRMALFVAFSIVLLFFSTSTSMQSAFAGNDFLFLVLIVLGLVITLYSGSKKPNSTGSDPFAM